MIPGFEGTQKFGGIGDHARVSVFEDRVLIIPPDMWGDPEGIAEKVAKVLNDNASLFFDSAKNNQMETEHDHA